jgi:ornithine decarboxylase
MIAEKAGVKIVMLNVGGGFPAQYRDSKIPPLSEFFAAIESQFNRWFSKSDCELVCEPGRSLVASSSSLLCRVKHRRKDNTLYLNDGIYGGFMEQFVTFFKLPAKVHRDGQVILDTPEEFKVYGPTCDSSDCFTETIFLPASIRTDDWIEFGLTGAYGSATTTRFNGYCSDSYAIIDEATVFAG